MRVKFPASQGVRRSSVGGGRFDHGKLPAHRIRGGGIANSGFDAMQISRQARAGLTITISAPSAIVHAASRGLPSHCRNPFDSARSPNCGRTRPPPERAVIGRGRIWRIRKNWSVLKSSSVQGLANRRHAPVHHVAGATMSAPASAWLTAVRARSLSVRSLAMRPPLFSRQYRNGRAHIFA